MTYVRPRNPSEAHEFFDTELTILPRPLEGPARAVELYDVQRLLESHAWRYAKTMPETPHWYTIVERNWVGEEESFYRCVQATRLYGERTLFRGWPYVELTLGGHLYWTMGYPVRMTTLINRKPIT